MIFFFKKEDRFLVRDLKFKLNENNVYCELS